MTYVRLTLRLLLGTALGCVLMAQNSAPRKKLLVIGEEKGYRHEAVPMRWRPSSGWAARPACGTP